MTKLNIPMYHWEPIKRGHPTSIPWGYESDPEDFEILMPIEAHLDALEQAKDWLFQQRTSRECAAWLTSYTGVSITHTGLIKRVQYDNERYK